MPSIITPEALRGLPPTFPLCLASDQSQAWAVASATQKFAVMLWPRVNKPADYRVEQVVETAQREARMHPAYIDAQMRASGDGVSWDHRRGLRAIRDAMRRSSAPNHLTSTSVWLDGGMSQIEVRPWIYSWAEPSNWTVRVRWQPANPTGDRSGSQWADLGWIRLGYPTPQPHRMHTNGSYYFNVAAFGAQSAANTAAAQAPRPSLRDIPGVIEVPLRNDQRQAIQPFRRILAKGGRVWSAEVEVLGMRPNEAAELLGVAHGQYSTRPDVASVIAASDSSVHAEIKVSCMRDGSPAHRQLAQRTYTRLYEAGARATDRAGHHVHVDGTRMADMGLDVTREVMHAAAATGAALHSALDPLCTSGYTHSRNYGSETSWPRTDSQIGIKGYALHGQRVLAHAQNPAGHVQYRGATVEFRMPSGTLEPVRAHAYVAMAVGLVDLAERAVLDGDPQASEAIRQARDRVRHGSGFDLETALGFMVEHFGWSDDSITAVALTGHTAHLISSQPSTARNFQFMRDRASASLGYSSVFGTPDVSGRMDAEQAWIAAEAEHAERASMRPRRQRPITEGLNEEPNYEPYYEEEPDDDGGDEEGY